jgi:hypothetical protein
MIGSGAKVLCGRGAVKSSGTPCRRVLDSGKIEGMKAFILQAGVLFALSSGMLCFGATKLDVSRLRAVPDGNYLMTLELNGKQERANVKVEGNNAKCVNSTDANMKNMEGEFQPVQQKRPDGKIVSMPGYFTISFQTPRGYMTQLWILRPDGAAAIRESPDRGEQQSAVPVSGSSLELPKAK